MKNLYSSLILAGGYSERMNYPKAFLRHGDSTFLHYLTGLYREAGIKNIVAVINSKYCTSEWAEFLRPVSEVAVIIMNPHPEMGRFHSIKLGIEKMMGSEHCFIQNVDNPFISRGVIMKLLKNKYAGGYVQPFHQGIKGHPVLISKKIMEKIHSIRGENNLRDVLSEFPKIDVEMNEKGILTNINTKEDYERSVLQKA